MRKMRRLNSDYSVNRTLFGLALLIGLLEPTAVFGKSQSDMATERFLDNVVQLETTFNNKTRSHGFGFVVGKSDTNILVVTAAHVVKNLTNSDITTLTVKAEFYRSQGNFQNAKVLKLSGDSKDIALLEITKPYTDYTFETNCFTEPKVNDKVWFIGRNQKWWVPSDIERGIIKDPIIDSVFKARINSVLPGTSGAPLISENGIVGMIIEDSDSQFGEARILSISTIKTIVTKVWNYPWQLQSCQSAPSQEQPDPTFDPFNLTGRWNSFFGPVDFTRQGQRYTGILYYSDPQLKAIGVTATIKGTLNGSEFTFVWYVFADTENKPTGRGVLTLSNDGKVLNGQFTDKNHPGATAQWQLVREELLPKQAKLLNQNSSKFLAVAAAGKGNGANVVIWGDIGQNGISWHLEPKGEDRYKIRNLNSGKYLAVSSAATTNGGNVLQWGDSGQPDIIWEFKRVGSSCYKIRNVNSGKYLAVSGNTTTNGGNVIQWQDQNQPDIVWCLK